MDGARFEQAFNSFGVQAKVQQGVKLAELAGASGVPALVIAGRWRTSPAMAGRPDQSPAAQGQQALAVADHLVKMARAGKVS